MASEPPYAHLTVAGGSAVGPGDGQSPAGSSGSPYARYVAHLPIERHLLKAKDLADRHYADDIGVAQLAEAAGLSQAHFARAFRKTFGETPHAYLLTRRLERAAAMLRMTDESVATICANVGLSSVGSFTTSFKRMFGTTPTAYRASHPPAAAYAMVPACIVRAYGRPQLRRFREDDSADRSLTSTRERPLDRPDHTGGHIREDREHPALGA